VNRRRFLLTSLAGLLSPAVAAVAEKRPRVGFLFPGAPSAPIISSNRAASIRGLGEEGYREGENITVEYRYAEAEGLLNAASELVRLGVDVIVAGGTPATLAAKRATTTIPIVGANLADPLADGLVSSLARPDANITGNTFLAPELGPKRLQLLLEAVPRVVRIAALQHPGVYSQRTMQNMLKDTEERARASGVELHTIDASDPNDFETAFEAIAKARVGALIIFPSPMFYVNHRSLVGLAAKHRLPTMWVFREAVEAGGLMCYGANVPDLARRAAKYAARILRGAKPAELPIEAPTAFDLLINLKAARVLSLTIPPSLLARADQVIE
jgi:ABC-type uncharacterized transport system substrate-binding protein